jgi:hypothetical protein
METVASPRALEGFDVGDRSKTRSAVAQSAKRKSFEKTEQGNPSFIRTRHRRNKLSTVGIGFLLSSPSLIPQSH